MNYHLGQDQQKWEPDKGKLTIIPLKKWLSMSGLTYGIGNIHWVIPQEVNPNFTGQKELLEEMRIKLCPSVASQSRKCFAIIGIGGVGKSEICLNFANIQRNE